MSAAHRTAHTDTVPITIGRRIIAGILGGLAGGLVFGIMMAMMGMLSMIAGLVGSDSALVGFIVHMVVSALIGLGLTVPFAGTLTNYGRGAIIGLLYGALWWVLGPLLLMPLMLGMPLFMVNSASLMSLVGHLIFGLILGLVAVLVFKKK